MKYRASSLCERHPKCPHCEVGVYVFDWTIYLLKVCVLPMPSIPQLHWGHFRCRPKGLGNFVVLDSFKCFLIIFDKSYFILIHLSDFVYFHGNTL